MTRSINPVAVSLLLDAARSLQDYCPEADLRQEPLDLTGDAQAIEAFMDERASLKDRLNYAQYEIGVLETHLTDEMLRVSRMQTQIAQLKKNDELMTEVLLQTSKYVESLKTKLASVGVTFAPDENGEPSVQVEPFAMVGFLDDALAS